MRACLALCVAATLIGAALANCDACLDGLCYQKHRLANITGLLRDIDRNTNTLYLRADNTAEVIKKCALDTAMCTDINGPVDVSVDQRTSDVYALSIRGDILVYPSGSDDRTWVGSDANKLVFKDEIYFSPINGNSMRTQEILGINPYFSFHTKSVSGTENYRTRYFVIDKHNDIYFEDVTNYRAFVLRRLSKGAVSQIEAWDAVYRITVDRDGTAVFFDPLTRAVYRAEHGRLTEVGAVEDAVFERPAFDADNNLVYQTDLNNFYQLRTQHDQHCRTSSNARNKRVIYYRYLS